MDNNNKRKADKVVQDFYNRKRSRKYGISNKAPKESVPHKPNAVTDYLNDLRKTDEFINKVTMQKSFDNDLNEMKETKTPNLTPGHVISEDDMLLLQFAKLFFSNCKDKSFNEELYRVINDYQLNYFLALAIVLIAQSRDCTMYYKEKILESAGNLINYWYDNIQDNHNVVYYDMDPFIDAAKIIKDDNKEIVAAVALILTGATTGNNDKAKLYIETANNLIYDVYHDTTHLGTLLPITKHE